MCFIEKCSLLRVQNSCKNRTCKYQNFIIIATEQESDQYILTFSIQIPVIA
jgi:hypothetical protein